MKKKETWPTLIFEALALIALLIFNWSIGSPVSALQVVGGYIVALLLVIAIVSEATSTHMRARFVEIEQYGERAVKRKAEWVIENFGKHQNGDEVPSDEADTFKRYGE